MAVADVVAATTGCVALWEFPTGTTVTDRVGSHTGTYNGSPGKGFPGYNASNGLVSIADSQYASVANSTALNQGDVFTLVALVRRNATQDSAEFLFGMKNSSGIRFGWNIDRIRLMSAFTTCMETSTTVLDCYQEHLVVARKNSSTERSIWLDGVSQSLATSTNLTFSNNTSAWNLGSGGGSNGMKSWMGFFALFNVAVSDDDIAAWQAAMNTTPPDTYKSTTPRYGLHASLTEDGDDTSRSGRATQAAGVKAQMVRVKLDWNQLENGSTQPGSIDWTRHDSAVDDAEGAGLEVLFTFAQSPEWANGSSTDVWIVPGTGGSATDPTTDTDYTTWRDAAMTVLTAAVDRYGPNGSRGNNVVKWECWNEPNLTGGWKQGTGAAPSARYYADFWSNFKSTVTTADADALPICGALGSLTATSGSDINGKTFLDSLVTTYSATFTDLSIHPYEEATGVPLVHTQFVNNFDDVQYIIDYLATKGLTSVKLHVDEFGWSTASVTEAEQATYITESLETIRDYWSNQVATAFVFSDIDSGGVTDGIFDDSAGTRRTAADDFETFMDTVIVTPDTVASTGLTLLGAG